MPSSKNKVSLFLTDEEEKVFEEFKKKRDLTNSEAVTHLMKRHALVDDWEDVDDGYDSKWEERLKALEESRNVDVQGRRSLVDNAEKLEEWVCALQTEVDQLRKKLKNAEDASLTDDVIAAVTGQREGTVREWRHGLRKPRGKRVLEKLAPYSICEGRWVRLKPSNVENVTHFVTQTRKLKPLGKL